MPVNTIARDRSEVVTESPDAPIREIAGTMRDHAVGSVVVERNGEPIGIVTDRDLALKALADHESADGLTTRDVMTPDPTTASSDEGVFELCRKMREQGVRRMPVVEDGKLTGIVTLDDVFVLLEDEMSELSSVIQSESPPYRSE